MRPLVSAFLVVLALFPGARAASAAEPTALLHTAGAPAGVALTGDGVLLSDELVEARVRAVGPGGGARVLFERGSEAPQLSSGLASSPTLAAFAFAAVRAAASPPGPVHAGPPGGPFTRVPGTRALALDVTGSTLVTVEGARGPVRRRAERPRTPAARAAQAPGRRLVARELGVLGATRELVAGRRLLPVVRAAGDYVAYAERAGGRDVAVVVDRRTGEETSRVALSGALEALDVQADGKLALATSRSRTETSISWTAARRPGVREVARGARFADVRITGDRIAFVRAVGIARELAVTDLDGFAAPASFPVASVEAFDFDGPRLAFATPRCLYLERVPGLTVRAAPPAGGPCARTDPQLRAPARAAFTSRARDLPVRVSCPMATSAGCPVALTLLVWRASEPVRLARVRARVPRGVSRTVAVRLSPGDLRTLRHRDPGPITLEMQPRDAGSAVRAQRPLTVVSPPRSPIRPPRPPRSPADDGPGGEFVIG